MNDDQRVYLDDAQGGKGFYTNKYGAVSISNLNRKILDYIEKTYGPFGFRYPRGNDKFNYYDININGEIINSAYIAMMVNNYTVFKKFIRENKIVDEITFYKLIEYKFDDVYNYNGSFFKRQTLPILINTVRRGNHNETVCKEKFTEYAKGKGLNITIQDPSVDEDIKGVDAKFEHNGRVFTIQIKPFSEAKETDNDIVNIVSSGSLSIGSVDYLMLYSGSQFILCKNTKNTPIKIHGNTFIVTKSNAIRI